MITGAAGFIGSNLSKKLVNDHYVIGIDNFDPFYSRLIKDNNIEPLNSNPRFEFYETDILDSKFNKIIETNNIDIIFHLAGKAGVRPSIEDPVGYTKNNIEATVKLMELASQNSISDIVFASSSSVYGNNDKVPFSENDRVDFPISPYAATKKACELLTHTYAKTKDMRIAAMRFFTVYGPGQRPDLAINKFTRMIDEGTPIPFYGDGTTERDYTFIDDIVHGLENVMDWLLNQPRGTWDVFNLGESQTTSLSSLVTLIQNALGKKAIIDRQPMQLGDVQRTFADISKSKKTFGFNPKTKITEGIPLYVEYYKSQKEL